MDSIKKLVSTILSFKLFNKYLIATILFVVWVGFFDKYNYFTQKSLSHNLETMERGLELKKADISAARLEKEHLENNKEKIAREKYLMHRENEEVFIIEK